MKIDSTRIYIREFQESDYQSLASIVSSPIVMKYSSSGCLNIEQTKNKIQEIRNCYKKHGYGKWAVIHRDSNTMIGYCGIEKDLINGVEECELGFRFGESDWGKGFATEAAKAALDYGLNILGIERIVAIVDKDNLPSKRVLEKIGMKHYLDTTYDGKLVHEYIAQL
jgi:ribosomal-protein-alanine N-acetyltransferase